VRARARAYARVYLGRGLLVRQPCKCGSPGVEMHHVDYGRPLDVIWLCRACHLDEHHPDREPSAANVRGPRGPYRQHPGKCRCGKDLAPSQHKCHGCRAAAMRDLRKRRRAARAALPAFDPSQPYEVVTDA